MADLRQFCAEKIDPVAIDRKAEIPQEVISGLGKLGVLGACLPTACGGMDLSQSAYCRILEVLGGHCGSTRHVGNGVTHLLQAVCGSLGKWRGHHGSHSQTIQKTREFGGRATGSGTGGRARHGELHMHSGREAAHCHRQD